MRIRSYSLLLLLLLVSSTLSAPPLVLTPGGGVFVLELQGSSPVLSAYQGQIVDMRGEVPEPPRPPGGPLTEKVAAWTREVNDPTVAQALAFLYGEIAKGHSEGSIRDAWGSAKTGADRVLGAAGATERWKPWREKVGAELVRLKYQDMDRITTVLTLQQISAGLVAGSGGKSVMLLDYDGVALAIEPGILDNLDLAKLIQLIKLILELLKLFGGGV